MANIVTHQQSLYSICWWKGTRNKS